MIDRFVMYSAQGFAGRGGGGMGAPQQQRTGSNFGGGGASPNSSAPGAGGAKRQVQPIRPLTIKQVLEAQRVGDGVMVIDGREATQVTVVGRVIELESGTANNMTAKNFGYKISDGTGMVVVRQWLDANNSVAPHPVGHFVRATGSIKVWQDKPIVTGTVRHSVDNNELTFHLLDAALTHLRITRGPVPAHKAAAAAPYAASSSAGGALHGMASHEKIYPTDAVLAILKSRSDAGGGLTQEEIATEAQRYGISIAEIRSAMKSLLQEGRVFNVDNTRYAC